jgi:mono/diheme cytochrome c family protein
MGIVRRGSVLAILVCLAACSVGGSAPAVDLAAQGDETFANVCARCHGQDGASGVPLTPDGPRPRDLGDPAWQASVTDDQLEATIRTGKAPLMPPFAGVLTPEQLRAVVGKVRRLRKIGQP